MKKFNYFTYCKKDGKELCVAQSGYLYIDKNGNNYGVCCVKRDWKVTELKTGLLVNIGTLKKDEIQNYIDSKADTITKLLEQPYYKRIIDKFSVMIEEFEKEKK